MTFIILNLLQRISFQENLFIRLRSTSNGLISVNKSFNKLFRGSYYTLSIFLTIWLYVHCTVFNCDYFHIPCLCMDLWKINEMKWMNFSPSLVYIIDIILFCCAAIVPDTVKAQTLRRPPFWIYFITFTVKVSKLKKAGKQNVICSCTRLYTSIWKIVLTTTWFYL
jgi:hypothetical protein